MFVKLQEYRQKGAFLKYNDKIQKLLRLPSPPAPRIGFSSAGEIRQNQSRQMNCKPDVVVSHILVNKNQNQNTRNKQAEQKITPQRYGAVWKPFDQKVNEQNNPRKEKRK